MDSNITADNMMDTTQDLSWDSSHDFSSDQSDQSAMSSDQSAVSLSVSIDPDVADIQDRLLVPKHMQVITITDFMWFIN